MTTILGDNFCLAFVALNCISWWWTEVLCLKVRHVQAMVYSWADWAVKFLNISEGLIQ